MGLIVRNRNERRDSRYGKIGRYARLKVLFETEGRCHTMNTKLLILIAFAFFLSWRKAADSFLLFCALFAVGLWVCVLIYRSENTRTLIDDE